MTENNSVFLSAIHLGDAKPTMIEGEGACSASRILNTDQTRAVSPRALYDIKPI